MKKILVVLLSAMTMGLCCSSALASNVSVKIGYNLAKETEIIDEITPDNSLLLSGGNGGGLVIGAAIDTEIENGFGVKVSITCDYMKNSIDLTQRRGVAITTPTNLEVKKSTVSGDALVTYDLVKTLPGLDAGVQAGVNFISTNIYDMFVTADMTSDEISEMKEELALSGGSLVVGAYAKYDCNDKLSLAADGYIGVLKFGNLASAFNNYKVNANISYKVYENFTINAGLTFANTKLEKTNENNTFIVNYDYKQLIPTLSVGCSF